MNVIYLKSKKVNMHSCASVGHTHEEIFIVSGPGLPKETDGEREAGITPHCGELGPMSVSLMK